MSMWMRGSLRQRFLSFSYYNRAQYTTRSFFNLFRSNQQGNAGRDDKPSLTGFPKNTRRSRYPMSLLGNRNGRILASAVVTKESSVGPALTKFLTISPIVIGIMVYLAPTTAVLKIKETGTTGGLPLLPYSSMLACGIIWSTYGILCKDPTIIVTNVVGTVAALYYVKHFIANCAPDYNYKQHLAGIGAFSAWTLGCATLLDNSTALSMIGICGDIVLIALYGGPLAVIKSILKERSTRNLPFELSTVAFLSSSLWFSYGILIIHDPYIWVPYGIGLSLTTIQMSFFLRFGVENAPFFGISPSEPKEKEPKEKSM